MAQEIQKDKPKNALSAAAAKKQAATFELDGFDDASEPQKEEPAAPLAPVEEAEPEVKTRKQADVQAKQGRKKTPEVVVVKPTDDFIRDKKGNIRKDEDGDDMRYAPGFHAQVGFVNEAGVRFPVHFKFKGGHIGTWGSVILNRCPKCHHSQSVDAAISGKCENTRSGPDKTVCGFDMVRELEEYEG